MRSIIILTVNLILLAACGMPAVSSEVNATHQRNDDVAVMSVQNGKDFCFRWNPSPNLGSGTCSGAEILIAANCHELERENSAGGVYVTLDCRDEVRNALGTRLVAPVIISGWKSSGSDDFTFQEHFELKKIKFVVKQSAFVSPTFKGAGFWVDEVSFASHEGPHGPNGDDVGLFLTKQELINGALSTQHVTLKSGELANVFTVGASSQYSYGGSSYAFGKYFRPYVRFEANGEEYFNWDNVADDYFVRLQTTFDRKNDIAQ